MRKLIFLVILISIAEFSIAQVGYRKGYIITNTRDTLFGLVDYREGHRAYKVCNFKSSETQPDITYEPGTIIGYGFQNDKFFQSKEILIEDQPTKVIFLEVLVKGHVSLYKFENSLFVEKDNDLHKLTNETKEIIVDGKTVLRETRQYIGTLNVFLFDCAEVGKKMPGIKLDERSITNVIRDYNRCKGDSSIIYKAKKPWTRAIIGITGGINISHINFETAQTSYSFTQLAGVFEVSKAPIMGVSFDIFSPRINERISLHADILYSSTKYYRYSISQPYVTIERDYVTLELQQLKIPFSIRYTFPITGFTPYFNIGISGTFNLRSNSEWIQETELNNVVTTHKNEALVINKNQLGLWGGLGVSKAINRKLNAFVELRYEQTRGISQNTIFKQADLISKITNIQILIGIRTR